VVHLGIGVDLVVEPGRSLVAPAGITLYRVVTVKRGGRTHGTARLMVRRETYDDLMAREIGPAGTAGPS
jgi:diaminopimelate decarboxylase